MWCHPGRKPFNKAYEWNFDLTCSWFIKHVWTSGRYRVIQRIGQIWFKTYLNINFISDHNCACQKSTLILWMLIKLSSPLDYEDNLRSQFSTTDWCTIVLERWTQSKMFARAHRAPDPTSSFTLAKFPVSGLFPRFWAPPHFPALLSTSTFSRAYLLLCYFPLFFPISPIQCFLAPINSCIFSHVRHLSPIP